MHGKGFKSIEHITPLLIYVDGDRDEAPTKKKSRKPTVKPPKAQKPDVGDKNNKADGRPKKSKSEGSAKKTNPGGIKRPKAADGHSGGTKKQKTKNKLDTSEMHNISMDQTFSSGNRIRNLSDLSEEETKKLIDSEELCFVLTFQGWIYYDSDVFS